MLWLTARLRAEVANTHAEEGVAAPGSDANGAHHV